VAGLPGLNSQNIGIIYAYSQLVYVYITTLHWRWPLDKSHVCQNNSNDLIVQYIIITDRFTKAHVLVFMGRRSCLCTSYRVRKPCSCYHFSDAGYSSKCSFQCSSGCSGLHLGSHVLSTCWCLPVARGCFPVFGRPCLRFCADPLLCSDINRLSTRHWHCICVLFLRLGEGIVCQRRTDTVYVFAFSASRIKHSDFIVSFCVSIIFLCSC